MADWNDLKKAFEKDFMKQAQQFVLDEQKLFIHVTNVAGIIAYKNEF